jgi:EAL domain-containing protein (putative c-di-GMP-specific phosphodiesterase class I)
MVEAAIERSGADPATISLEITESALMEDVEASALVLQELKDLGCRSSSTTSAPATRH